MPEALIGALATALAAAVGFLTALQDHWRRLAGAERRLLEELHAAQKTLKEATDGKSDTEDASLPQSAAADLTLPTWDDGEAKGVLMASMDSQRRRQVEATARSLRTLHDAVSSTGNNPYTGRKVESLKSEITLVERATKNVKDDRFERRSQRAVRAVVLVAVAGALGWIGGTIVDAQNYSGEEVASVIAGPLADEALGDVPLTGASGCARADKCATINAATCEQTGTKYSCAVFVDACDSDDAPQECVTQIDANAYADDATDCVVVSDASEHELRAETASERTSGREPASDGSARVDPVGAIAESNGATRVRTTARAASFVMTAQVGGDPDGELSPGRKLFRVLRRAFCGTQ